MIKKFLLLVMICIGASLQAQNLHHTYFEFAPLYVNPALAGGYEGTLRISGIYRDQYRSVTGSPFVTFDGSVEYNLPFRPRKRDWIAAGLSISNDRAGTERLVRNMFRMGATYHLALDKKAMSDIALGVQFVSSTIRADRLDITDARNGLTTGNDADIMAFNERINNSQGGNMGGDPNLSRSYSDYVVGLVYTKKSKAGSFRIGASGSQFIRVNSALINQGNQSAELPLRLVGYFHMERILNKTYSIEPAILYQNQGPANDIVVHTVMGYNMNKEFLLRLKAGLGYRVGDAAQVLLGADYKDWKFGFSYDLNVSSLTPATNTFGGFELSAMRQINIKKKPDIKPVIFCPRL